jgi:hypothetical protein
MRSRRITIGLALASALGATQDSAVFRANTRLVQINVIVRDKDGPVANLSKSDFVLTDRGKPPAITVFSVHKPAVATEGALKLPENTFSNRAVKRAVECDHDPARPAEHAHRILDARQCSPLKLS